MLSFVRKNDFKLDMRQVIFSEQSLHEIETLGQLKQLEIMEAIGKVTSEDLSELNSFDREGVNFYRMKLGELRIYFEIKNENLTIVQYILQQHTFMDFIFRFKLPINNDILIESKPDFWKYLESLRKKQ